MWQEIISTYVIPAFALLISALFTWLSVKIKSFINKQKEQIENEQINNIIDKVVSYVEQTGKELTSSEKFDKAMTSASEWLNKKGVKVSNTHLEILIESAVNSLCGKEK